MHRRIDRRDLDTRRPFTRQQALEAGLTDDQLRGAAYRRILTGIHISSEVQVTARVRATAALAACGGVGHISHHTAARAWGAWVPDDPDVHVSVLARDQRRQRDGMRCHLAHPTAGVVRHRGLPTSSPVQCFLDLAARLPLVDLVVLGDSLVHRGHVTPEDLIRAADAWPGHRARSARRAARLVRRGVESPRESRLRLLLVLAGMPEPQVNRTVEVEGGRARVRLDLSYPGVKVAVEYDGRQHAENSAQWQRDLRRREWLDVDGWRLIVVTAEMLDGHPGDVVQRVAQALTERGVRARISTDDAWRRHFPGYATA